MVVDIWPHFIIILIFFSLALKAFHEMQFLYLDIFFLMQALYKSAIPFLNRRMIPPVLQKYDDIWGSHDWIDLILEWALFCPLFGSFF